MNLRIVAAALLWTFAGQAALAEGANDANALRTYLNHRLKSDSDIQFRSAEADLDGDGKNEVIVYVTSHDYCGSGGCETLVLKRTNGGYQAVMHAMITRLPIRILDTRHHGWRDIGVIVGGGGIDTPYEAVMRFDGHKYPSNPTMPPAKRANAPTGTILIAPNR